MSNCTVNNCSKPNYYVGMRYVPIIDGEWDNTKTYESLVVVTYNGNSYISKRPVPQGIEITNTEYWIKTSDFNAQLAEISNDVEQIQNNLNSTNEEVCEIKSFNTQQSYNDFYYQNYKEKVCQNIVSYLARTPFSDSVTGLYKDGDLNIVMTYDPSKTYFGYTDPTITPTYTDTQEISNVTYKNMYLDCGAFVGLITRGRDYLNSPYYYNFSTASPDNDVTNEKCLEVYSEISSFDMLGYTTIVSMGNDMDSGGCYLLDFATLYATTANTINNELIGNFRTGDLIFLGKKESVTELNYRGLHHVGIYIKNMDDLTKYQSQYGVTLSYIESETGNDDLSLGFVVDCDGSVGATTNVLSIKTLDRWLKRDVPSDDPTNYFKMYVSRPYPSANISNKLLMMSQKMNVLTGASKFTTQSNTDSIYFDRNYAAMRTNAYPIAANSDLNTLTRYDQYYINNLNDIAGLVNKPADLASNFVLFNSRLGAGSAFTLQIIQTYSTSTPALYIRALSSSTSGTWKKVTLDT